MLSVDIMDISGEHQNGQSLPMFIPSCTRRGAETGSRYYHSANTKASADVNHDMSKTRLSKEGLVLDGAKMKTLKGDLERIAATKAEGGTPSLTRAALASN